MAKSVKTVKSSAKVSSKMPGFQKLTPKQTPIQKILAQLEDEEVQESTKNKSKGAKTPKSKGKVPKTVTTKGVC